MRRRLILLFTFAVALLGASALSTPASAAAVGKTGVYSDGCGNKQIWVNGQNLGPYYLVCMPPAAPQ